MKSSQLFLITGLGLGGCAADRTRCPGPPVEPCEVRLFAVGDLTLAVDNPPPPICYFHYAFPPGSGGAPRPDAPLDEEALLGVLRRRAGVESPDPRGYLIRMEGRANVLAVGPPSVTGGVESALVGLRSPR